MFVLYDYSAILYKSFHFSKSFRCFFSKSIVFLSFSSILQQRMAAPTFPEDRGWCRNPCRIRSRQNRREAVFSVPGLSFVLTFHLRMRWKLRQRDPSSCADWKNRRRRGLGDESGRECNTLIFRHINRMLKREALQEDKQALLGFQTGVSWGVSRPWLTGK